MGRTATSTATRRALAAGAYGSRAALLHQSSFPVFDLELWLVLRYAIRDLELQVLGAHSLVEGDGGASLVVTLDGSLPGEERHQFMLTDFEIAEIEFLDAALQQGFGLARRIQIVLDFLVVDLEGHRIQGEKRAHIHRDVDRHL